MPDIVMDVSATFVAKMTLRVFGGAMLKALFCSEGVRRAYSGQTSICETDNQYLIIDKAWKHSTTSARLTCIFLLSNVGR
jgi:hypothetical protein